MSTERNFETTIYLQCTLKVMFNSLVVRQVIIDSLRDHLFQKRDSVSREKICRVKLSKAVTEK